MKENNSKKFVAPLAIAFLAPLQTTVRNKYKAAGRAVCDIGN